MQTLNDSPCFHFFRFSRKRFGASLLLLIPALAIGLALAETFAWVNKHSVEVASLLTFHSEKPVSYLIIDKCLMVVECLLWIAVAGSLLSFVMGLFSSGWQHTREQFGKVLMSSCSKGRFFAGLLSVIVFGGSAYVLANWRPKVSVGFWDYSQLAVRVGLVLILLAAGWLFWLLSLARLNSPTGTDHFHVPPLDGASFPGMPESTSPPQG